MAMRHVVWANLGVYSVVPDTVVFVSNEGASNQRHIANEQAVADGVRRLVAHERPGWKFVHQRLETLSYANELRLMRRTTVLIALFGSAIHNWCARHRRGTRAVSRELTLSRRACMHLRCSR